MGDKPSKPRKQIKEQPFARTIPPPSFKSKCLMVTSSSDINVGSFVEIKAEPSESNDGTEGGYKTNNETEDKRERIENTEAWPNRVHGLVLAEYPNDKNGIELWGTGTLIGPNLVITAAHNIYDHDLEKRAKSVKFIPGLNGKTAPFNKIGVKRFFYPEEFANEPGKKEDFALLILDENIGDKIGYFGMNVLSEAEIKAKVVNITGYPQDKIEEKDEFYEMWGMSGKVEEVDKEHISYKIATYRGQSGSSVYYKEEDENKNENENENENEYYVIGVHKKYNQLYDINQATVLNEKRFSQIQDWCKRADVYLPLDGLYVLVI